MYLLHMLFGRPTQDDWDCVRIIRSHKTMKVVGERFISVDPCEVMASQSYKEAIQHIRKMEADDSWVC
jgi:hypothetical protein